MFSACKEINCNMNFKIAKLQTDKKNFSACKEINGKRIFFKQLPM